MPEQLNKLQALEARWQEQRTLRLAEREAFERQVADARYAVAQNGGKAPNIPTTWAGAFMTPAQAKEQLGERRAEMGQALGAQPGQYAFTGQGMHGPRRSDEDIAALVNGEGA